jgi:hypothetical protein
MDNCHKFRWESSVMEHVTNQKERARELLAAQYRDGDLEIFVDMPMERIQEIEDALWDLYEAFDLSTAVGVQLDALGRIAGLARSYSDTDDVYRIKVAARLIVLRSRGTLEDVLSVFHVLEPDSDLVVTEYQPAKFTLEIVDAVDPANVGLYSLFLKQARAGGVRAILLWRRMMQVPSLPQDPIFTFTSMDDSAGTIGWGSVNDETLGGVFIGAIES